MSCRAEEVFGLVAEQSCALRHHSAHDGDDDKLSSALIYGLNAIHSWAVRRPSILLKSCSKERIGALC